MITRSRAMQLAAGACWFLAGAYGARDLTGFVSFMLATSGGALIALALRPPRPSSAVVDRAVRFVSRRAARRGNIEFRQDQALREAIRLGAAIQRHAMRSR